MWNCPKVLYLFTVSDFQTLVLPVTVFAYLSAPNTSADRMLCSVFWTWLHLLQFCISNQSIHPKEDSLNKPWRPIPSGLISVNDTRTLRWVLLPLCLFFSVCLEAHWPSISLAIVIIAYNELHMSSHWFLRGFCYAWGNASFNAGALQIAAGQPMMISRTTISIAINSLIILSTIHTQDFRDQVGDKLVGRQTIPILWPKGSRIWILANLVVWSAGLSWACGCTPVSVPFCALGVFIGLRIFRARTTDADKRSYRYYNVWLMVAQVIHIPGIATTL
ncbi:UbiA prenyltransferase family [Russula earlei]|uniref:UbiA prenyltransferase family n=1 Tax=Russula earlei TaxID=71964 RepID=A0ACC0U0K8_9AGAM|nr:UbiA prenyltransferase family [Russula earlei]